jgi:hypothetical protein
MIYVYFFYWVIFKQYVKNYLIYSINNKYNICKLEGMYIHKFYSFNKIYINLFSFSNNILNNYLNNLKVYYNNLNKK